MLQVAPRYIAKLSPMLDISHVLSELDCVRNIMAVGTTTECKELVVTVERGYDGEACDNKPALYTPTAYSARRSQPPTNRPL